MVRNVGLGIRLLNVRSHHSGKGSTRKRNVGSEEKLRSFVPLSVFICVSYKKITSTCIV